MEEVHAFKGAEGNSTVEIHAEDHKPFTALVFKTMSEPHVGDVSYFRIYSGCIANGQDVFNATRDTPEKLNHLSIAQGKERIEVNRLCAGDIGCVAKLKSTHTNDTLSTRDHPVRLPQIDFPEPIIELAVHATARADEEKLQAGLHKLHEEDPTFQTHYNSETHETIVSGVGERHLEISMAKLRRKYTVQAQMTRPKIAYRETLKARAEGQGKHKKQTGGRGQFGDCWVRIAPSQRGGGYEFIDKIVGGAIPRQYIPAVDRGIQEASVRGVLAGYPMVDFKVEVFDGSYHTVDSNEQSFKMAGIQAFKTVAPKCKPVLLEPLSEIDVVTPDEYMGDVLGDLSSRRGQILGTEAVDSSTGATETRVQSMTQGRATFTKRFKGYEEMPHEVAQRVIDEATKEKEEEAAVH
jgi:elongation factor G